MAILDSVRQEKKDRRLPPFANMFAAKKNYATHIGFDVLPSERLAGKMLFCILLKCVHIRVCQSKHRSEQKQQPFIQISGVCQN